MELTVSDEWEVWSVTEMGLLDFRAIGVLRSDDGGFKFFSRLA